MENLELVIVGNSGLMLYDQEGTRGIHFWKVGSRKFFAVEQSLSNGESDDEEEEPLRKRRRPRRPPVVPTAEQFDAIVKELMEMKNFVRKSTQVAIRHNFNGPFLAELEEAFKCCICKVIPSRSPIVACTGCVTVLGCQSCIDTW
uniref:Uncharacterized protein n=1 Tax=Clytia hemisphaerica TaxID=252671 RepID=A0A7M5X995_9CNID